MPLDEQELKSYKLRVSIDQQMHELLEVGYTIDDIEDFITDVISDMREEEEDGEESED